MGKKLHRFLRVFMVAAEIYFRSHEKVRLLRQRQEFPLLDLPPELILLIATHIRRRTLCRLVRVSKHLHSLLMPLLYQHATTATCPDKVIPFQWFPTPGRTILHFAAAHGEVNLLSNIIQRAGRELLDARDPHGMTPLVSAVLWGQTKAVQVLLQAGADPEARSTACGLWTARKMAAATADRGMLPVLAEYGIVPAIRKVDRKKGRQLVEMLSYEMDMCRWCVRGAHDRVSPVLRGYLDTAQERCKIERRKSRWRWRMTGCTEAGAFLPGVMEAAAEKRKTV